MKKSIVFILIFISMIIPSQAQSFEGAQMTERFSAQTPFVESNLTGKKVGYADYSSYQWVNVPILSKKEALTLAMLLIKSPKDFLLRRDVNNFIISSDGCVVISYLVNKNQWLLDFEPGDIVAVSRNTRCYFVE